MTCAKGQVQGRKVLQRVEFYHQIASRKIDCPTLDLRPKTLLTHRLEY